MLQDPFAILSALSIPTGAHVADFGCGNGTFVIPLSKIVGEAGAIYAVDVQKDIVTGLENKLHRNNISNVHAIWADIETIGGTKLRDASIDWVVLANVLFQAPDRITVLKEALRVLKPGGKVAIIDWKESFNNMGPHAKDIIPEAEAKRLLSQAGFGETISRDAGIYQYALVATKNI